MEIDRNMAWDGIVDCKYDNHGDSNRFTENEFVWEGNTRNSHRIEHRRWRAHIVRCGSARTIGKSIGKLRAP